MTFELFPIAKPPEELMNGKFFGLVPSSFKAPFISIVPPVKLIFSVGSQKILSPPLIKGPVINTIEGRPWKLIPLTIVALSCKRISILLFNWTIFFTRYVPSGKYNFPPPSP